MKGKPLLDLRDLPPEVHTCQCKLEPFDSTTELSGNTEVVIATLRALPPAMRRTYVSSRQRKTTIRRLRPARPEEVSEEMRTRKSAATQARSIRSRQGKLLGALAKNGRHPKLDAIEESHVRLLEERAELVPEVVEENANHLPLGTRRNLTLVSECPQHQGWSAFGEYHAQRVIRTCGCSYRELLPYRIDQRLDATGQARVLGRFVLHVCDGHAHLDPEQIHTFPALAE